jgi:hypothetical protein
LFGFPAVNRDTGAIDMRYMAIHRGHDFDGPPSERMMEEMGALIGDMADAGVLVLTGGLLPSSQGFTIRENDDEAEGFTIIDGPFTEAKEVIGGFAIIDVESTEEAIEWSKRFLKIVGEGYSEVRAMFQPTEGEPDIVKGEFERLEA